ncbi:MAG TPA: SRPBCC family protein [Myxococcota bacterium]|nr:SRPBCC family protein [Myxococcota bacterium]
MVKFIVLGLLAIVGVLAIIVALQPTAFVIERSASIQAPAAVIYPHIVSPRAMNGWSPFALGDPNMKIEYSGPDSGVGARSAWESQKMGSGSMTVTETKPDEQVTLRLDFVKPFQATNTARFILEPQGQATRVTWRMEGQNGFMGKAFGLLMNTDKMVGGQFEQGLSSMKTLTEAESAGKAG